MLPLYLSIEGLYSYQEKQEIDFTKLTEAGLFGIFGNVGSGKSSILEAISYALYGETERLNKQEKRAYNMLNLKSEQAVIDFQFLNFENRKFRFIVQWKRRKRFEDTTTIDRLAYEWIDDTWIPMESADGALVTNLSYPNFRRTIIIPQGQFKEFLELKGKERSDMMKEIFFLNQYDLGPKVGYLQAENNKKVENLKGALTGFEEVSEETKEQKIKELEEARIDLANIKLAYEQWSETFKKLAIAKENRQDLYIRQQEWNTLNAKQSQIKQYENDVNEYESVSLHFREHINNLHHITSIKRQLLVKIERLQDNKELLRTKIDSTQQQISNIQNDYNNLDNYKRQLNEYQLLVSNVDLIHNKDEVLTRIDKGTPIVIETKAKEQQLLIQLSEEESSLEQLKKKRINTSELLAIESWYQTLDEILRQEDTLLKRLVNHKQDIAQLEETFAANNLELGTWQDSLQMQWNSLQEEQKSIQDRETALRLKQELSHYILNLNDGEPCPLCGSAEHPSIMHAADVTDELEELKAIKKTWADKEQQYRRLQNELTTAAQYLVDKQEQEKTLLSEQAQVSSNLANHHQQFHWPEFDKTDRNLFEKQKSAIKQLEELIEVKELTIKNLRIEIQATKEKVNKYEKSLEDFKNQVLILDAKITQNLGQITVLKHLSSAQLTKMELIIQFNQLEEKIKSVDQQYKEWTTIIQEDKGLFATVVGQLSESQEQYKAYNAQLQLLQSTINSLLNKFNFADITQVKAILGKSIDTSSLRQTIQQFYLRINSIAERIYELQEITKEDNYSEELFVHTNEQMQWYKAELEKQISKTGAIEKELQNLIVELDKKSNLLQEYSQLNARKDNLKILDNMFKGNGFVNYVSSIHLVRLCEIANNRFHRLTKNQLSLCVNEANEFEVKDYLNNGYQRSVKTLSGGQSFQASLCLALALAENIQALNKADRNFFFIDEGFGTQDNESINTVFDTLQYLHQENRVVGIISHVEELKERMPRSVTVTKDLEKGSQVNYN